MERIMNTLRSFTLEHFGTGKHRILLEEFQKLLVEGNACVVDLRSKEEVEFVKLGFAKNIPLSELPDRIDELPKDKTIILFCSGKVRAPMAYLVLSSLGYRVKILDANMEELSSLFKPGFVLKASRGG